MRIPGHDDPRTLYQTDALYHWQRGEYFPPVTVEVSPTHDCIQACRYCYSKNMMSRQESLRDDVLIGVFPQMAEAGVKAVFVQGTGEPLLHKALPQAVTEGIKAGLSIGLTTSGVLLTKKLQDALLPLLLYVRFSVIDCDPNRYAYLHGCGKAQGLQLIENIRDAVALRKELDLPVSFLASVYVEPDNFDHVIEIVKFYKDLGLDRISVQEATYLNHSPAGPMPHTSTLYSDGAIQDLRSGLLQLCDDDFTVRVHFPINDADYCSGEWKPGYCQGIKFGTLIGSDGEVYPCWRAWGNKALSYGSLYKQTFEQIWHGDRRRQIERHILTIPSDGDECKACNATTTNAILWRMTNATAWKDFLI